MSALDSVIECGCGVGWHATPLPSGGAVCSEPWTPLPELARCRQGTWQGYLPSQHAGMQSLSVSIQYFVAQCTTWPSAGKLLQ